MNDDQHDALIDELRKLRGEVHTLRRVVIAGVGVLIVCGLAVAAEYSWFEKQTVNVLVITGLVCFMLWLLAAVLLKPKDNDYRVSKEAPASGSVASPNDTL